MADLAVRLKVFVASPSDLLAERDIVEKLVTEAAWDYGRHRLLLQSFRWENGTTPGYERPNARTVRQVRTAELTVVMFWSRLGSAARLGSSETGSLEELRIAGEGVLSGSADDVFVYFKTHAPPPGSTPEDVQQVAALRTSLQNSKEVFAGEFATQLDFENLFRKHLRLWTDRWIGVPEICEFALDNSGGATVDPSVLADDRLHQVLLRLDLRQTEPMLVVVGQHAVESYQRIGHEAWLLPLERRAADAVRGLPSSVRESLIASDANYTPEFNGGQGTSHPPFVAVGRDLRYSSLGWFAFFCAAGLLDAIAEARVDAVVRVPYINEVHQYLKALARERRVVHKLSPVLRRWLISEDGCTDSRPVARNFAAYVLGMIGAIDAQDDLVRAIHSDRGRDVKLYAITSLGKLRARQQMHVLKDLFAHEADPCTRLMIAQAVCRMTGVAEYEM